MSVSALLANRSELSSSLERLNERQFGCSVQAHRGGVKVSFHADPEPARQRGEFDAPIVLQLQKIPAPPEFVIEPGPDGFGFVNLEMFKAGFAADTSDADAAFLWDIEAIGQKLRQDHESGDHGAAGGGLVA